MNDIAATARDRLMNPAAEALEPRRLDVPEATTATATARKQPVDLAAYYRAAEGAGGRAAREIFDATISDSAEVLHALGVGFTVTGAFFAGIGGMFGEAIPMSLGQGALVAGVAAAGLGWLRRHRTVTDTHIRDNRQRLLAMDAELQPSAAEVAKAVLRYMQNERSEKKLSPSALASMDSAFDEMRSKAALLSDDERRAASIAAAVNQLMNVGFRTANEVTTIREQLAGLCERDAARVASEVALRLFHGPDSRYSPRFIVDENAPQHVLEDFRVKLLALVPPPCPIQRTITGSRYWLRAGESVTIPGLGPVVARGLDYQAKFETMDGRTHRVASATPIIRAGTRYRTMA